ncbi:LysR family transcriptional regulator [Celeribacter neptunius]|uniref:Transcriptional regulator, LysR family n=1 Tax=Celeribacter neptunius TaxID=588602 RepID=A0A1I3IR29_9RHOB|nr:LysR family transcriptional regulator [Celeribacter neptunius]SFI50424.1 transcriptional regulator, LysR family [Celeribacter neptunius]
MDSSEHTTRTGRDWSAIAFDWNRARAFLVTAEEGSLSAAARALKMSQPTLGRQVTGFEEELGVTLFDRGPRGLSLTPTGLALLEHMRRMGEAALEVTLTASGQAQALDGLVSVSVSELVAANYMPPVLKALRETAPQLQVELVVTNDPSDLRRREADVAIRSFRPTQPDLIARKLCEEEVHLYAEKDYAEGLAPDLSNAAFIGYDTGPRLRQALAALGLDVAPERFLTLSNSHLVVMDLVRAGLGVGILPDRVAARDGDLVRVGSYPPLSHALWAVAHHELRTSARIRVLFDALVQNITS